MPRNSAGTYSLPAGNPVVTGTTISSVWGNTTMSDIATALTGSLARNGDGGMTGQLKADSGAIGAPGIAWASETTSGWYRASAGNFRFAIGGADVVTVTAAGVTATMTALTVTGSATIGTGLTVTAGGVTITAGGLTVTAGALSFPAASIADAALSSNVPLKNATNTFSVLQTFGAGITVSAGAVSLPAASIADAALSSNVPLKNAANVFTTTQTITVSTMSSFIGGDSAHGWTGTSSAHPYDFYTTNILRGSISATGNWTINAPSSGVSLTVPDQKWEDGGIALQAYLSGGVGNFGTTTNHGLSLITNNVVRVAVGATGGVQLGSPTGGDKGASTINAAGDIYINDVPVALRNLINRNFSSSDNTVAGDNGGLVGYTGSGGHTFTLDSSVELLGALVLANYGTATFTLAADTTLFWMGGAGSIPSGNRTIAIGGIVTAWRVASGNWYVWGTGIT